MNHLRKVLSAFMKLSIFINKYPFKFYFNKRNVRYKLGPKHITSCVDYAWQYLVLLFLKLFNEFKTIDTLDKALRIMQQIRDVPEMKSICCGIQSAPTVDEIDEITVLMQRLLAKLRVQVYFFWKKTMS